MAIPSAFLISLTPLPPLLPNLPRHHRRRREKKRQIQVLPEKYAEETGGLSLWDKVVVDAASLTFNKPLSRGGRSFYVAVSQAILIACFKIPCLE
jgi:hypothetical protein